MDEDLGDFIEGEYYAYDDPWELDADYEFDASRFFDFTRSETCSEAQAADDWFYYADSYPPSPFVVKLNLGKILASEQAGASSRSREGKNANSDVLEADSKSLVKPVKSRSSTLMKPTASHLAKQNKLQDVHYSQFRSRLKMSSIKLDEKSLQSPPGFEDQATKRQKLESGFLRKVAQLKHQSSLLHKKPKKVTIPKEPQLETTQRAERHRSRNTAESSKNKKPEVQRFKPRPLNRKMLEGPSIPPPKKSSWQLQERRVADKHWDDSVGQSCVTTEKRLIPKDGSKKEKCETLPKSNMRPLNKKESGVSMDMGVSHYPPTELFSKLCIKSECEGNAFSQSRLNQNAKGSKENSPRSFRHEFQRCIGKPNQCAGDIVIPKTGHHPKITRSLDIR